MKGMLLTLDLCEDGTQQDVPMLQVHCGYEVERYTSTFPGVENG